MPMIRVPAIGERVRLNGGTEIRVHGIAIDDAGIRISGWSNGCLLTFGERMHIVGPYPKWIEITLPGEEPCACP